MVLPSGGRVCHRLLRDLNSNVEVFFLILTSNILEFFTSMILVQDNLLFVSCEKDCLLLLRDPNNNVKIKTFYSIFILFAMTTFINMTGLVFYTKKQPYGLGLLNNQIIIKKNEG